MQTRLGSLLETHSVMGAGLAVVRDGSIEVAVAGTRDAATQEPVDADTVFDAASLTKPLVAYAVLQLADAGLLALDQPLAEFVRPIVPDDPAARRISLRHLLTHTCGLQNLRDREPLRLFFEPGAWFSYSSVGFMYLQLAVEAKTGEPLEASLRRLVFDPLGMQASSLEWREAFARHQAVPHEGRERIEPHRPPAANASYSLKTTARDYGAFVAAVLAGSRLDQRTWRDWLAPAVMVPHGAIVQLASRPQALEPGIGWGLGWGVEPGAGTFFHWGKMTGSRAFVMGSPAAKAGVVLFTNSNTGLRLMHDVVRHVLPGEHPAIGWLANGVTE